MLLSKVLKTLITPWFESHVHDNNPDCMLKLQTPSKRVGDHPGSVTVYYKLLGEVEGDTDYI